MLKINNDHILALKVSGQKRIKWSVNLTENIGAILHLADIQFKLINVDPTSPIILNFNLSSSAFWSKWISPPLLASVGLCFYPIMCIPLVYAQNFFYIQIMQAIIYYLKTGYWMSLTPTPKNCLNDQKINFPWNTLNKTKNWVWTLSQMGCSAIPPRGTYKTTL